MTTANKTKTGKSTAKPAAKTKTAAKKPAPKSASTSAEASPSQSATQPAAKTGKTQNVTFRIHRGSVVNGVLQKRTQDFTISYEPSTTVLMGLEQIKAQQDGSLTFRRSCRASICGSCGMVINNRSRLACKTKIADMVNGVPGRNVPASGTIIEISPQRNQPVLKDLVVDIQPFYKKVERIKPFVQNGPETVEHVNKNSFEQVNMVSNCIMCGACYSDCTAMVENPNFIGPAALAKAYRFVSDPREGDTTKRLQKLSEKDGIWDCTRCGMCVDACPKGVAPMEAIVKLRTRAIEHNIRHNRGARHALVFKGDIKKWGVLNEMFMVLKTFGPLGALSQLPNALNLAKKGKIPHPFPTAHKPKDLHEIGKIYAELKKNPISVETRQEDTGPGAG